MRVAIIGAGVSGLVLAQELVTRGATVTVFEKSRGLGGRLATKRLDWANIDIGAQYFTARDERFKQQVEKWLQDGVATPWDFTPYVVDGSHLKPSPDTTPRYVGIPDMNKVAHAMGNDLDLRFCTRIESLEHDDSGWTLVLEEAGALDEKYDWVVSTLPAEQSTVLLANTIIADQIPQGLHQPCWALALATKGEVAPEIQGIFGDEVVSWVSRLSSRPQRQAPEGCDDLWMLHFSSEWSTDNGKETDVDVLAIGYQWLSNLLKEHTASPLEIRQHYKHYWRYARVSDEQIKPSIIADRSARVAAIGAWSTGGKVEGAYLSALHAVDMLFE